ncbi:hypothetical protein, partial [Vibrio vulnificus]
KTEHKWASSCEVKDGRITVVMGYSVSGCPAGMELNQSGVCEEPEPDCSEVAQGVVVPDQSWPYKVYGSSPRVCSKQCIYRASTV